jgi:trimeric autotransporter adhesin
LLFIAGLAIADPPPMSIQSLFGNLPKETAPQAGTRIIIVRGNTLRQLAYSSIHVPIATTDVAGIVKVGTGLAIDGAGVLNNTGISGVAAFNGRGGAVTPAANDYSIGQISGAATVASTGSYNDLSSKPTIPAAQVSADWSSVSGVSQILNKPTIPSLLSQLTGDATHRTVTDTNLATWNAYSQGVPTVFGRTGAITAQSGDYTAVQVGADALGSATSVQTNLNTHTGNVSNPHSTTATQVGLGNVTNTSDANKPVSSAQQTALNLKQDAVTAITTSNIAAQAVNTATQTALDLKLPKDNPTATGTLTAPIINSSAPDGSHSVQPYNSIAYNGTGLYAVAEGMLQTNSSGLGLYTGGLWKYFEYGLGNPTINGYCLQSTTVGVRSWGACGGGGGTWGSITGTLSSQSDLNTALTGKLAVANNLSDVTASTARTNLGLGSAATMIKTSGTGTYVPAVTTVTPSDGCATWAGGVLNSAGVACGTSSGGSGTVNAGLQYHFLYYPNAGSNAVAGDSGVIGTSDGTSITTAQSATLADAFTLRQKIGFTGAVTETIDNISSFTPYTNTWPQTQPSGVLKMTAGVYGTSTATDILAPWTGTKTSAYCMAGDGTMQSIGGSYSLPTASTSTLGGVKVDGTTITISGGVITSTVSGGGTVTAVTGTAPVVSSGGTAPAISMAAATDSVPGYMTAADHTAITANTAKVTNATHTGDATGATALSVVAVQGYGMASGAPTTGDFWRYNGTSWLHTALVSGDIPTSVSLTTPVIGAATGTSLAVTGTIDGTAILTVANGGTITAASSYNITSGATPWILPPTATGKQACFRQANNGTNLISITPPTSSYLESQARTGYCTVSHAIKSGGAVTDSVCFIATDATHWQILGDVGTWTCQ